MIEAKNLVKYYENHLAVDHISFSIDKGHIVGFLGPNGAGKSTTMNMITGYISATEGDISIDGHDIYEEPEEAKKRIGYLPEIPPLYPNMTVYEYLKFAAGLKGVKHSERRDMLNDIIEKTGLEEYRNRLIRQLSKGYKQRVGMAQALIGNPEVLIFDEPTVGLDPAQIIEIRNLIKELAKDHTVILSSHIMQEISAVCDTVMIIDKGRLIANDSTENITRMATKKTGLVLEVEGDKQVISDALREIPEITSVSFEETEEGEPAKLTIYTEDNADIRGKLFPLLSAKGCNILTLKNEEVSLEQAFLTITGEAETERKTKKILKHKETTEETVEEHVEESAEEKAEEEENTDDSDN